MSWQHTTYAPVFFGIPEPIFMMLAMAAVLAFVLQVERRRFYALAFAILLVFIYVVFGWALNVPLTSADLFS